MYEIDPSLRKLLLKEHNDWRNQLAEGAIPGFPPATRMMKMVYFMTFCVPVSQNCIVLALGL